MMITEQTLIKEGYNVKVWPEDSQALFQYLWDYQCGDGMILPRHSIRNGYVKRGEALTFLYKGRFGEGICLATYLDPARVNLYYYLKKRSGRNGSKQK